MTHHRSSRGRPLTPSQAAYLIETGEFTAAELEQAQAAVARGELAESERQTRQHAINASLDTAQVAARLRISVEDVDQLRDERELFAFRIADRAHYPLWQFTGDPIQPVLPGLAGLVDAFPDDWHPAAILAFMSTPKSSARINGEPVTPVEWMRYGGDVVVLRGILESFLQS